MPDVTLPSPLTLALTANAPETYIVATTTCNITIAGALGAYEPSTANLIAAQALNAYVASQVNLTTEQALLTYTAAQSNLIAESALSIYLASQSNLVAEAALNAYTASQAVLPAQAALSAYVASQVSLIVDQALSAYVAATGTFSAAAALNAYEPAIVKLIAEQALNAYEASTALITAEQALNTYKEATANLIAEQALLVYADYSVALPAVAALQAYTPSYATLIIDAALGAYEAIYGWAMNVELEGGVSKYEGLSFTTLGKKYAIAPDGIYTYGGTTDNGTAINAFVTSGKIEFKEEKTLFAAPAAPGRSTNFDQFRVSDYYQVFQGDKMTLTVTGDRGVPVVYTLAKSDLVARIKANLARGEQGRAWEFKLANIDGGTGKVRDQAVIINPLKRRYL